MIHLKIHGALFKWISKMPFKLPFKVAVKVGIKDIILIPPFGLRVPGWVYPSLPPFLASACLGCNRHLLDLLAPASKKEKKQVQEQVKQFVKLGGLSPP